MYLKCLLEGIADLPATDIALRQDLEQELAERSAQSLHDELAQKDPVAAGVFTQIIISGCWGHGGRAHHRTAMSAQWLDKSRGGLFERTGLRHESVVMLPCSVIVASAHRR